VSPETWASLSWTGARRIAPVTSLVAAAAPLDQELPRAPHTHAGASETDDQSFANELGPSGSTETTVYPTNQGGMYHITVNSECDWNVTVSGS